MTRHHLHLQPMRLLLAITAAASLSACGGGDSSVATPAVSAAQAFVNSIKDRPSSETAEPSSTDGVDNAGSETEEPASLGA